MKTLDVKLLVDFQNWEEHGELIRITSDFSGKILFLFSKQQGEQFLYTIIQSQDDNIQTIYLEETKNTYTHIQPVGQNWLLVEPRIKDSFDKNGHLYNVQGKEVNSFHLGDGIEDVQTTDEGCIWISYNDEGVTSDTLGSNGLNCFNPEGHLKFSYHNEYHDMIVEGQLAPIDDCYALNVMSTENVFVYYYGHFPLVNILERSSLRLWENVEMEGSHAMAIKENVVLFDSEYNSSNKVYEYHLQEKRLDEWTLHFNDEEFQFDYAFARKDRMYFVKEQQIYMYQM